MEFLRHVELSSPQSSIVFDNIPQDGTDLYILCQLRTNGRNAPNGGFLFVAHFNGSTTGYSYRWIRGNGNGTVDTATDTFGVPFYGAPSDATAGNYGNASVYISNYRVATAKSAFTDSLYETNAAANFSSISTGYWTGTAAITSITLKGAFNDTLVAGSSATLYKVTAGSDGITTAG